MSFLRLREIDRERVIACFQGLGLKYDYKKLAHEFYIHYYFDEINYNYEEFLTRLEFELVRQVDFLNHVYDTKLIEYDVLNYNKNERTLTNTSKSDATDTLQDSPIVDVTGKEYNKNKSKSVANVTSTSNETFYHKTELKTNQKIIAEELDLYISVAEELFAKTDYLFVSIY